MLSYELEQNFLIAYIQYLKSLPKIVEIQNTVNETITKYTAKKKNSP